MIRAIPAAAFPALLLAAVCAGCGGAVDPASMHIVNTLSHRIDSLRERLAEMDTTALLHMRDLFTVEQEGIETRFKDTLPLAEAEVLGNYYRAMAGTLPRILDDRQRLQALLGNSSKRLEDLQHDLCTGHMQMNEAATALSVETAWCDRYTVETRALIAESAKLQRDRAALRGSAAAFLRQ